jgi:hypothetical protein
MNAKVLGCGELDYIILIMSMFCKRKMGFAKENLLLVVPNLLMLGFRFERPQTPPMFKP